MSQNSAYSGLIVELVRRASRAPLTSLAVVACVGVWLGISAGEPLRDAQDWERWGVYAWPVVNEGAWWGLLTSCFVHDALWHLAFNVYWLWVLGSRIEAALGAGRYGALSLVAGAASTLGEMLTHDGYGYGYSGIDYALFGFALAARERWPALRELLTPGVVVLWGAWFVLCIVSTELDVLPMANTAHAVGFVVGLAWGWQSSGRQIRGVALGAAVLLALAIGVVWRPWSPHWNYVEGFNAHRTGDFERAQRRYDALIRSGGDEAWARAVLAHLHYIRGDMAEHRSQLERARALDPALAEWATEAAEHLEAMRNWAAQMCAPQREFLVRAVLAEAEWRYADARAAYREHVARFPSEYDNKLRLAQLAADDDLASRHEIEEAFELAREVESKAESLAPKAKELRERLDARRR